MPQGRTLILLSSLFVFSLKVQAESPVDFNRDIRPILSDACFQCHGPDAGKRKANLRLDTRDGLFGDRESGTPVIPRQREASELLARIHSSEDEEKMPPPGSGKRLTPDQVALIERWIDQGASWQGHWSYEPLKPVDVPSPALAEQTLERNPIDRFITKKLNQAGVSPAPEADRATLLRRLSLDLTGLPPGPMEAELFLNDSRADAYERQVDRLLASPQYGERLAQFWLDLVRYADTIGYHGDNHQDVGLYRDWVISAFRNNMPFDKFTVEQIAGDLLPGATFNQKVASGYNRMLMTTREGGSQAKEYEAKYAADRVRNASTVWLGATLGCAQCHDHKYDPYTTADFYRFAAYFADIKETAVGEQEPTKIPDVTQAAHAARLDDLLRALTKQSSTETPALSAARQVWEESRKSRESGWVPVNVLAAKGTEGVELLPSGDGSVLASGPSPDQVSYTLLATAPLNQITGFRIEALPDASLPLRGPGRSDNGNAVISEVEISIDGVKVPWMGAQETFSQKGFPATHAIDGKPETGWAFGSRAGRKSTAVLALADPKPGTAPALLQIVIRMNHGTRHTLGRFRISTTAQPDPLSEINPLLPDEIEALLAVEPSKRTPEQTASLAGYYRSIAVELTAARNAQKELQIQKNQVEAAMPTTLVSESLAQPRTVRILPRGNWLDETGEVVSPAPPGFLPQDVPSGFQPNRLDLARWMVSNENPLVARVFVNRIWKLAFGRGLVATADDFGSQGAWPSNPALLDWLASEFRNRDWDIRWLVKTIVESRTYRQSSLTTEELQQRDPDNALLAHQNRFRIDAEQVRDQVLASSGLLIRTIGGPSARPYQPAGYWSYLNFPTREYQPDHGAGLYRRGLYTYWCRTFLHPSMLAFDAPSREECTVDRPRSNTPLQALVLLNDPTYVEAARALAERVIREANTDPQSRLELAYRLVLVRAPRPEELAPLQDLYANHRTYYQEQPAEAAKLLAVGELPIGKDLDQAELAATTSLMRVILNLHETITRY